MNGKGSKRRPRLVSRESFEDNWHQTFGPKKDLGKALSSGFARMLPCVDGSDYWNSYYKGRHLGEVDPERLLDRLPEVEENEQAVAKRAERLSYMRELKRRAK